MVTAGSVGATSRRCSVCWTPCRPTSCAPATGTRSGDHRRESAHEHGRLMGVPALKEALPSYAKDIRLNLDSAIAVSRLPEQRLWGTVLATANRVTREAGARRALPARPRSTSRARPSMRLSCSGRHGDEQRLLPEQAPARRRRGGGYEDIPARLRMQVIGTHGGVDVADFEFWCFAVSSVNGCGAASPRTSGRFATKASARTRSTRRSGSRPLSMP